MVAISFVLIYAVQNALVFLLGWEIAAVAAWLLVIWDYRSQKIRFAGFNYLVSTHVGLFVLVAAFMLLHSKTGSMDFAEFGNFMSSHPSSRGTLFLLLGISFALKSAFFPFHTWVPRAALGCAGPRLGLDVGRHPQAGLFGFLRFALLGGRPEEWMGWSVLLFGAISAIFGVLYTSTQRDLQADARLLVDGERRHRLRWRSASGCSAGRGRTRCSRPWGSAAACSTSSTTRCSSARCSMPPVRSIARPTRSISSGSAGWRAGSRARPWSS